MNSTPSTEILHARCVTGVGGGPEKTILNSRRFLSALGYNCACAYLHPVGDDGFRVLERRAEAAGALLVGIPDRGPFDIRVIRRLSQLCRERKVAIWHGHDYKSNALGLLVRWFWPMKLVTTVHGWVEHTWRTPLYYAIDRLCLQRYEQVICVSQDLYQECLRIGIEASRCHWVNNGIDTEQFRRRQTWLDAGQRFRRSADRLVIGAMGRLSEEKGFDLLIRAVSRISHEKKVELWIAGEGGQRAALQRLIDELGQSERIKLLGHVDDTRPFYEALDVFALSSIREGLPNVLLEAMALEVPVVATRIAGIPSLVQDSDNGLLVEPGSVDALQAALSRMLTDDLLRRQFAAAGRRTIENSFSFERRMQKIVAIYDALLTRQTVRTSIASGS